MHHNKCYLWSIFFSAWLLKIYFAVVYIRLSVPIELFQANKKRTYLMHHLFPKDLLFDHVAKCQIYALVEPCKPAIRSFPSTTISTVMLISTQTTIRILSSRLSHHFNNYLHYLLHSNTIVLILSTIKSSTGNLQKLLT